MRIFKCVPDMRKLFVAFVVVAFTEAYATAETLGYSPLAGDYLLYSGGLGDPQPPMKGHSKIAFEIRGAAAKAVFDALGRDVTDVCVAGNGDRIRKADHGRFACLLTKQGEYFCNFGFDLKSGKSIGGMVC